MSQFKSPCYMSGYEPGLNNKVHKYS